MTIQLALKVTLILLALSSENSIAKDENKICKSIKKMMISGEFRKYSIPFKQPTPDYLEYDLVFGEPAKKGILKAYCGNGSDATCEMTLIENDHENFTFGLPATIRLLEINNEIYIINGVRIDHNNHVSFENYMVNQLFSNQIKLICSKQ